MREAERKERAFLDFFELTEEQEAALRERVASADGHVRIVVHPFAGELPDDSFPGYERNRVEKEEAIYQALLRWANTSPEESAPILLFEEEDKIEDLKTRLEKETELKNEFYVVPTFSNTSDIKLSPDELYGRTDHWGEFMQRLEGLGVGDIIVGGKYLMVREGPIYESGRFLSACVGNAVERLSPMFHVEVSHLSHPDSRKKLKEIETRRGEHGAET